ncbi:MAG: prepilin-type N-terminal cleavage/methylation domain-containing protein [Planctomycetota bacterium]
MEVQRQKLKLKVKAKRCGFTLAEMLAVVIIISLLAGLGGGIYVGTYKKMLVEKAARHLVLTAKYARIMAIEKQRQYEIQLDVANNAFYLTTTQWNEDTEQTEQIVVKDSFCKPVEFEGDVKFEDVQITPTGLETTTDDEEQAIVFLSNGTAQSAVIQVGDGKTHYTISISTATGKAKLYFGAVEDVKTGTDVRIGAIDLDAE